MKKQITSLFWVSEINFLLWLGCFFVFFTEDLSNPDVIRVGKGVIITGCILAYLLQKWAYHRIYKPSRKQGKEEKTEQDADDQAAAAVESKP